MDAERLRTVWRRVRRRVLDENWDEYGEPWMTAEHPPGTGETGADAPSSLEPLPHKEDFAVRAALDDAVSVPGTELASALNRLADSFERVAESIEADRHERRAHLDDIETVLRELATTLRPPTSVPPVVLGGSIEPAIEEQIDLLEADTAVDP